MRLLEQATLILTGCKKVMALTFHEPATIDSVGVVPNRWLVQVYAVPKVKGSVDIGETGLVSSSVVRRTPSPVFLPPNSNEEDTFNVFGCACADSKGN